MLSRVYVTAFLPSPTHIRVLCFTNYNPLGPHLYTSHTLGSVSESTSQEIQPVTGPLCKNDRSISTGPPYRYNKYVLLIWGLWKWQFLCQTEASLSPGDSKELGHLEALGI